MSNTCSIPRIIRFILQYLCVFFQCDVNVHVWVPIFCLCFVTEDSARALRNRGGCEVIQAVMHFSQVCARNYSGSQFSALSWGPILVTIPVHVTEGDWGYEIHRSCGSMTSRPQLWFLHWPSHVCVKWVPRVFLPWVNSNSWVQIWNPPWSCHPLRGETDIFSVNHGIYYRVFLSFPSPTEPGAFPLVRSCRYLHPCLKIWRMLWYQSGFPISSR